MLFAVIITIIIILNVEEFVIYFEHLHLIDNIILNYFLPFGGNTVLMLVCFAT